MIRSGDPAEHLEHPNLWHLLQSINRHDNVRIETYPSGTGFFMAANSLQTIPGYQFDVTPDLNRLETRERLSQSAVDGFFAIMDRWRVPMGSVGGLLGGMPRSTVYKLKTAAGTLRHDELTRISYLVGIYKALHILLPDDLADRWMTQPNDDALFGGRTPLAYVIQEGIPGLHQVRSLLDAARGGQ